MSSVVSLWVPGLVALFVTAPKITDSTDSIHGVVASVLPSVTSVFPDRCSVGSDKYVLKELIKNGRFNQTPESRSKRFSFRHKDLDRNPDLDLVIFLE